MSKNDGGFAFPQEITEFNTITHEYKPIIQGGMSLRDWFAGMAMQGILIANEKMSSDSNPFEIISIGAYKMADAMLKERKK